MDPDAYNKYAAEFRQKTNDANVIPFNKDEGIRAIAADSEEGKEITKGILDLADRSSGENIVTLADPVLDAITAIKGLEPMDAMKEANLVAGKQGKYANLSDEQVNKIIEDTNDHIFERDPIEPEDFAKGGRVNFNQGSNLKGIKQTFDDKTSEAFRVGNLTSALGYGPENYENLQNFVSMPVQDQQNALMTFRGLRSPDPLNSNKGPFEKQGFSSDIRHGLGTSAGKDAIIDYISSKTPIPANSRLANDLGIFGANIASLFEEGKDIFSSAKDYAERYPGITGIQDYDYVPDNKYLTQPFEDISANNVGSKLPYGMSTPQKIAFLSNYKKYGNQTLDQVKNLERRKIQKTIRAAEQKAAQESQRQADQARINRAYREETGGQGGSYATGQSGVQSDGSYNDPFDPGGGE
jgi:hypothetical protein